MRGRLARAVTAAALTLSIGLVAAPQAHAAFPGENGRIVFDTVNAYWSGQAAVSNLYSVRPDGTGLKQLTDVPDGTAAWHPNASPDARRVVYLYTAPDALDQAWIMHADGSHQHPLVDESGWEARGVSFTANGRRVLYSRCGFYVPGYWTCKIVTVRLDGSGRRVVIGGRWHPSEPVMAPGGELAYVSDKGGFDARIWLADADGSDQRALAPTFGVERLSWSPDGTQLAFTGNFRDGSVFTIGVSDTGPPLAKIVPGSLWPAWSPDGMRIASKVEGPDADLGFGSLRTTLTDGTHPTVVVPAHMGVGFSDWGVAS
jgi:Tol biopolymer transport system component